MPPGHALRIIAGPHTGRCSCTISGKPQVLRSFVQVLNGRAVEGAELAQLLERMIAALNARDIPTAGSILEHFNQAGSASLAPLSDTHCLRCRHELHSAHCHS